MFSWMVVTIIALLGGMFFVVRSLRPLNDEAAIDLLTAIGCFVIFQLVLIVGKLLALLQGISWLEVFYPGLALVAIVIGALLGGLPTLLRRRG